MLQNLLYLPINSFGDPHIKRLQRDNLWHAYNEPIHFYSVEYINIQPPKRGPPLETINQRGSGLRFHQPKGDPPLNFINQKWIPSTKKRVCLQGQFLWILRYTLPKRNGRLRDTLQLGLIDVVTSKKKNYAFSPH